MSLTPDKSQLDISGNAFNEEHSENILTISITFAIFHFEIFGILFNDEHSENILLIFVTLSVFHFDISGRDSNK